MSIDHKKEIAQLVESFEKDSDEAYSKIYKIHSQTEKKFLDWIARTEQVSNSIPIQSFKGLHAGKRGFIICNGPSLNSIDLSLLKNEITFGCNRIYLGLDKWGLRLNYWAVQDETQIIQQYSEYPSSLSDKTVKFIPFQFAPWFQKQSFKNVCYPYLEFFYDSYPMFNKSDPWFFSGMTVSYWLMQLALFMGLSEVYIVGMDHSYKIDKSTIKGKNRWVDPKSSSHFHPDYMNASNNQLWNIPDVEKMEMAYSLCAKTYEEQGKRIYNATPGTKCDIFEKVKFEDIV